MKNIISLLLLLGLVAFQTSAQVQVTTKCNLPNCATCDAFTGECLTCKPGFFAVNTTYCISEDLFACDGKPTPFVGCESCVPGEGFELNARATNLTACSPCQVDNCTNCEDDFTSCKACNGSLILKSDTQCFDISTFGCEKAEDFKGCTKCKTGQGPVKNFQHTGLTGCGNCLVTACADCSVGYDSCDKCLGGFVLATAEHCQNMTGFNCLNSTDYVGCTACPAHQGFNKHFQGTNLTGCSNCQVQNCDVCDADYSLCAQCKPNFIIPDATNQTCMDISHWNCTNYVDGVGCDKCLPGHGFINNYQNTNLRACAPCKTANCAQCYGHHEICEICAPNAVMLDTDGSDCVDVTNWGCVAKSDLVGCTACNASAGFFHNYKGTGLKACAACLTQNCGNCTKDYTLCHNCTEGFALAKFSTTPVQACVDCTNTLSCPRGLCQDFEGCIGCGNGFFKTENMSVFGMSMCSSCPGNCTGCVNATWCTNCDETFHLQNITQNGIVGQMCFLLNGAVRIAAGFIIILGLAVYQLF